MNFELHRVVAETPLYAWLILAWLVGQGLRQTRDQIVSRTRLWAQPLAVGAYSLASAALAFGLNGVVLGAWALSALAGVGLAQALRLRRRLRALADGRVAIAGSWLPLAIYLAIYAMRYASCASLGFAPELAAATGFVVSASAVHGLPIGLLAARALPLDAPTPLRPGWQAA
jgi:hypothetical protein